MGSFSKICVLAAAALLIAVTVPLHAQPAVQAPISWKLDPVHSFGLFRVQHMNAGMFWGRFNDVTGTITHHEDGSAPPSWKSAARLKASTRAVKSWIGPCWGPSGSTARNTKP